jgi:hypothetical protein
MNTLMERLEEMVVHADRMRLSNLKESLEDAILALHLDVAQTEANSDQKLADSVLAHH